MTTTRDEVAAIRDLNTREILDVLDPESERQNNFSCGGYYGYCGGCDVCVLMQVQHSIEQGAEIEIVWVERSDLDSFLDRAPNWSQEPPPDDNLWIKEGF